MRAIDELAEIGDMLFKNKNKTKNMLTGISDNFDSTGAISMLELDDFDSFIPGP